jgi:hypothetical protein
MENDGTYDRKIAITAPPDISFTRGGSLVHRKSMSMQLSHPTEIQDESNAKNRGKSKIMTPPKAMVDTQVTSQDDHP